MRGRQEARGGSEHVRDTSKEKGGPNLGGGKSLMMKGGKKESC